MVVFEPWTEVPDFGSSGAEDAHFMIDDATGVVELGPRIRSPQGEERQYGKVPPQGRHVRFSTYRTGGGVSGNVGARTLVVLRSSIPYVASVINYAPAIGGTDTEDIEHARWRAPQVLRSRDRAVTAEDFEVLALQATPAVARARCIDVREGFGGADEPNAGRVRLQLVPAMPAATARCRWSRPRSRRASATRSRYFWMTGVCLDRSWCSRTRHTRG